MESCSSCSCSCLGCGCLLLVLPIILLIALLGGVFTWLFPDMQFYIEPLSQALQGGADFFASLIQAAALLI